jgi:methyl acetate hydrolase
MATSTAALDRHLQHVVQAAGGVPGVVALVTDRHGLRHAGVAGVRTLGGPVPMTLDTVLSAFSLTKAITGAALMQLVEAGRVGLDAPAGAYVPEIDAVRVLDGFDTDGTPRLRPPRRPITVRHLLLHVGGFGYPFFNHDLRRYREATRRNTTPDVAPDPHAHIRGPLLFDPGDRWEYGTGIDWAGRIVEAVRGQRLGDAFRDHLLGPLGMDDTRYAPTRSMHARLATMHRHHPSGEVVAETGWSDRTPEVDVPPEPEVAHGGGGLFTTALDYACFLRMILAGGDAPGGRVLRPETVDLMATNGLGKLRSGGWQAADPLLTNAGEFLPGTPKGWGLTFQIARADVPGERRAGSLAWAGLGNLYFWIDRATGIAGFWGTQLLPFYDPASHGGFVEYERLVYRSLAS